MSKNISKKNEKKLVAYLASIKNDIKQHSTKIKKPSTST